MNKIHLFAFIPSSKELGHCAQFKSKIDLFEAEDKFHVLSFYINDPQSLECAKSRVIWMSEAGARVRETLKTINQK